MCAPAFLAKAEEALASAQALLERSLFDSAASRAYYAVFHAARAALVAEGVGTAATFWSHDAIQGAFSKLTRRRKIYPAELSSVLTVLQELRLVADYKVEPVSSKKAHDVVKRAATFVGFIAREVNP